MHSFTSAALLNISIFYQESLLAVPDTFTESAAGAGVADGAQTYPQWDRTTVAAIAFDDAIDAAIELSLPSNKNRLGTHPFISHPSML